MPTTPVLCHMESCASCQNDLISGMVSEFPHDLQNKGQLSSEQGNSPHCVDMPKATALNHVNLTRFNHHTGKQLIGKKSHIRGVFINETILNGEYMRELSIFLSILCVIAFANPIALVCTLPAYMMSKRVSLY